MKRDHLIYLESKNYRGTGDERVFVNAKIVFAQEDWNRLSNDAKSLGYDDPRHLLEKQLRATVEGEIATARVERAVDQRRMYSGYASHLKKLAAMLTSAIIVSPITFALFEILAGKTLYSGIIHVGFVIALFLSLLALGAAHLKYLYANASHPAASGSSMEVFLARASEFLLISSFTMALASIVARIYFFIA